MPTVKELRLDARIYDLVGHNLADDEYIFSHIHLAFHAPDAKNERASKSRETSTIVFPHGHTISEVKKKTDRSTEGNRHMDTASSGPATTGDHDKPIRRAVRQCTPQRETGWYEPAR